MRAKISVIIPTLNAADALPGCAAALFEGLEAGLIREMIVSDGGSADATAQVAASIGAEMVTGPPSRGGQLRRGVAAARGDWLLVLHADTQLAPGWSAAVLAHLTGDAGRGQAGYFRLGFDRGGRKARAVAGWANLRARLFGLPYGDQGLLVSRATYDSVGGYRDQVLMEDVAIARALRGRLTPLSATAITSAARYEADGWFRRGARNITILLRYLAGADPERLARAYFAAKG